MLLKNVNPLMLPEDSFDPPELPDVSDEVSCLFVFAPIKPPIIPPPIKAPVAIPDVFKKSRREKFLSFSAILQTPFCYS